MIGREDDADNRKVGERLGQLIVRSDPFHALNVNELFLTSMPSELSVSETEPAIGGAAEGKQSLSP